MLNFLEVVSLSNSAEDCQEMNRLATVDEAIDYALWDAFERIQEISTKINQSMRIEKLIKLQENLIGYDVSK